MGELRNCGRCAKLATCSSLNATLNFDGECSELIFETSGAQALANRLSVVLTAMVELVEFERSSTYRARMLAPVAIAAAGRVLREIGVNIDVIHDRAMSMRMLPGLVGAHPPTRGCDCASCRNAIAENIDGSPHVDDGLRLGMEGTGPGVRYATLEEISRCMLATSSLAPRNETAAEYYADLDAFAGDHVREHDARKEKEARA